MTRTIISIDDDIKTWLDRRAQQEGVSMSEVVRKAIRLMREKEQQSIDQLLDSTRKTWPCGDGLEYQNASRDDWTER